MTERKTLRQLAAEWVWSQDHGEPCRVIETETLWGQTICRVWFPGKDTVVRLPQDSLQPLSESIDGTADAVTYVAAAARIADALTEDMLLAPVGASVIPLPHQLRALSKAVSGDRVRYLLADEVGLGKTIEAGLILRELKLRGLVRRTLVIAPKGLATQWVAEMKTHFNEDFRLMIPSDFSAYRRIVKTDNMWKSYHQIITSMDSVKPIDSRRGWSRDRVDEYNRERFEDLISAGWDLVIVDEAHRLGGSTDQVARYQLGRGLAEAAPYLLLLSATPHQGKSDAFYRLMSLIDDRAFPSVESVTRERVRPYVIRTEKPLAIDAEGKPLFKPRRTEMATISWEARHRDQQLLYEAVTDYVREGYNQALRDKQRHVGFLMILMQRLVVSSTRAIRTTLERRLEALAAPAEKMSLFPFMSDEDWADMDGQEQLDTVLSRRLRSMRNERAEVELLLEAAIRCEQQGPDVKAETLLEWIYRLQSEENDSELKVLIFTEFVPTQQMLYEFLTDRGFSVVRLNGSMDMEERKVAQDAFAKSARILISTDAGGEGLNLQFCHVVINYDLPWNPMRLEQRIGRVDRIGQRHVVRAINFVFADSVEHRVREVLERKLAVILEEFGIDKTGDVLDSAQAGNIFDELYVSAIMKPDELESKADQVAEHIQSEMRESKERLAVLGETEVLDPEAARRMLAHPLPYWTERMTVSYLRAHGGQAEQMNGTWNLTWPDGETVPTAAFSGSDMERCPWARHMTLEDPKVRGLTTRLSTFVPGQPLIVVSLPDLSPEICGIWSLWRIAISAGMWNSHRIVPSFVDDKGRVLNASAWRIWDALINDVVHTIGRWDADKSYEMFQRVKGVAEDVGKTAYDGLVHAHRERLSREREKAQFAFASRRKVIERVGLEQVRKYRLNLLADEERRLYEELDAAEQILPEIMPLIVVRVEGGTSG